jgi:hemerythrin
MTRCVKVAAADFCAAEARRGIGQRANKGSIASFARPILVYAESKKARSPELHASVDTEGIWRDIFNKQYAFSYWRGIDMRAEGNRKSIWQESMRVGLPELDEERKNVFELLELLEMRPIYSIASETFASRFDVVQEALERFLKHEESVLKKNGVPDQTRRLHLDDHEKIRQMLDQVREDSLAKKNQTGLDVYKALRTEVEQHVRTFGFDMTMHLPNSDGVGSAH